MIFLSEWDTVHEISSADTKDLILFYLGFRLTTDPHYQTSSSQHSDRRLALPTKDHILQLFNHRHRIHVLHQSSLRDFLPFLNHANPWLRQQQLQLLTLSCLDALSEVDQQPRINHEPQVLTRMTLFIREHLLEDFSISDIAQECAMSERHLRRICLDYTGHTVVHLIQHERLQQSRRQLLMGFSVAECARRSGFNSSQSFCRCFKKFFDESPGQFQRRELGAGRIRTTTVGHID